jgi:hypothetical protein
MYETDREKIYDLSQQYMGGTNVPNDLSLHKRIFMKFEDSPEFEKLTGLYFGRDWKNMGIRTSGDYGNIDGGQSGPSFRVQNLRLVSRVSPDGGQINEIIFSLIQRSGVVVENEEFKKHYNPEDGTAPVGGFELWGGCTLIFDLDSVKLKYAISRPLLDMNNPGPPQIDKERAVNQYNYQRDGDALGMGEYSKYFGLDLHNALNEPFSLLHQH